ncbi:retrovirus-related pol polyprotein from transposon TNT 1-94 [Tanacetum coccineum]
MLAPKGSTFNGRPTFANPMYLKKAQSEKPCLYEIPYDPSNKFTPDKEETLTLEQENRSKLNKDLVKPYDYTKQNNSHTELQCLYLHKVKECDCLAQKLSNQTETVSKEVYNELSRSFDKLEKHLISLKLSLQQCQEQMKNDKVSKILPQTTRQAVRNTNVIKPGLYRIDTKTTQTKAPQLSQTSRNTDPCLSTSTGVIHRTNVSRPQLRSTQMKDKVVPNNSQVTFKKTEVEDHHMISSNSNKTKSVTACNDNLKSRTLNINAVCATYGKCVFNSNHDARFSKFIHDVNARTKKPKIMPISTRKPKSQANKSVATPPKRTFASVLGDEDLVQGNITINRGNDLLTGNSGSDLYTISFQEMTSSTLICFMAKASPTQAWLWHQRLSHLNFDYINLLSKKDIVIGLPKLKYAKD